MPPALKSGPKTLWLFTVLALAGAAGVSSAGAASDAVVAMTAPIYQRVNPGTKANLVTPWADEASAAGQKYGYTTDLGAPFKASTAAASGLTSVHRLFRASSADFTWALEGSAQLANAVKAGYQDQGTNFYAAATPLTGTEPVNSYVSGNVHRLWLGSTASSLASQGWSAEGAAFYVPAAATTPTPPTPPVVPNPPSTGGGPGAATVGTASYAPPSNAVYVSPSGSDSAAGSASAPLRTIARAVSVAASGGTVVLRGGRYHETVTVSKTVTLQNYPGEAAWLDGAEPVSGWVQDGSAWRHDGWTTRFDHSPTYTRGAPDSGSANWQFLNPSYPMAAHPDQVFVDGAPLQQVSSRGQVTAGTFYLDEATSRLYVGTNPGGRTVEASTLVKAMSVRATGTVIRGIGIRRFSPSVPDMAAVTLEAPRIRLENVVVRTRPQRR